ncbi:MAG: sulfatase-like hydrolase/transferase, partial [Planctomycetota bacterium]
MGDSFVPSFLLLSASLLTPTEVVGAQAESAGARPNVLVILADDLGYGDVGANNPDSKIPTPHLDRLAAVGMRFTDAHSPAAWCTPTRYSLLTGRYSRRGRPWKWAGPPQIEEGAATLPGIFQAAGYRTAMVGKWHLGVVTPDGQPLPKEDRDVEHRGGPVDRGFDSYFGIDVSLDGPPYYYIRDRRAVVLPTDAIGAGSSPGWTKIQGDFWRAGRIAPGFAHQNVLPDFRDEAVRTVRDLAAEEAPFLFYLSLATPHTPWAVTGDPAEYAAAGGGAALYGQFMHETDAAVGAVLAALEEAGVAENTLVVFTSDNGPVWYDADEEKYGHASAGGFRGMKG